MSNLAFTSEIRKTFKPRQNVCDFAAVMFKCIFLNENFDISIKRTLKFGPKGRIDNIPTLVQIMAARRPGEKPLFGLMMIYWRIYASLGLNELTSLIIGYTIIDLFNCLLYSYYYSSWIMDANFIYRLAMTILIFTINACADWKHRIRKITFAWVSKYFDKQVNTMPADALVQCKLWRQHLRMTTIMNM